MEKESGKKKQERDKGQRVAASGVVGAYGVTEMI